MLFRVDKDKSLLRKQWNAQSLSVSVCSLCDSVTPSGTGDLVKNVECETLELTANYSCVITLSEDLYSKKETPGSTEMELSQASYFQPCDFMISQIKTVIQIPNPLGYVMGYKTLSPDQSRHLLVSTGWNMDVIL